MSTATVRTKEAVVNGEREMKSMTSYVSTRRAWHLLLRSFKGCHGLACLFVFPFLQRTPLNLSEGGESQKVDSATAGVPTGFCEMEHSGMKQLSCGHGVGKDICFEIWEFEKYVVSLYKVCFALFIPYKGFLLMYLL